MQTNDLADENFKKLKELFPNAVTETIDENGDVVRAIDKDVLRQEINAQIIEGPEERYQFTWPGKRESIRLAATPIAAALRPCREESVNFDTTENVYIEGDNLDVLKLLRETYIGMVNMIYIDPPYNTGNDFIYDDDFAEDTDEFLLRDNQYDDQGNRLIQNTDSNGRFHTDWLNMIYPRLKVAKDLLHNNGVVFISIDDNEYENLKKVCDEVFGPFNLVNVFIWNCSTAGGIRPKFASKTHEYILCYAKDKDSLPMFFAPLSEDAIKMYTQTNEKGRYRDKDFVFKNKSTNPNQKYLIECPDGEKVQPKPGYIYRFIRERFNDALKEGLVTFKRTETGPLVTQDGRQAHWNIYIKKYLGDAMGAPSSLIPKEMMSIYNVGTQCVQQLFDNKRVFDNAKPVDVITYLSNMASDKNSIIMDFFSGSATTAHAVMQLNAEDGGKRKYIMVQIPEHCSEDSEAFKAGYKNICEIGKERIRRAGKKIKEENLLTAANLDIGFRVFKLDSSNMKDVYYSPSETPQKDLLGRVDNIKQDRTPEDLLFQVMLEFGIPLSSKIKESVIAGKKVFNVEDNYLIACFDDAITEEAITAIAKEKPQYVVLRDSGFKTDSVAANFEQIFATYSPDTTRRVL